MRTMDRLQVLQNEAAHYVVRTVKKLVLTDQK